MNKQEFTETLAERCELSKAEAGRTLEAILDSLTEVMADHEEVSFTGFGKFLSQRRRAREGVNPQDPTQKIKIRAAYVPKFRPGASLRQAVSELTAAAPAPAKAKAKVAAASMDGDGAPATPAAAEQAAATSDAPADWSPLGDRS